MRRGPFFWSFEHEENDTHTAALYLMHTLLTVTEAISQTDTHSSLPYTHTQTQTTAHNQPNTRDPPLIQTHSSLFPDKAFLLQLCHDPTKDFYKREVLTRVVLVIG